MAASSSHAPVPAAAVGQIKAGLSIVSIHIIIRSISSFFAVYVHKAGEDMELRGISALCSFFLFVVWLVGWLVFCWEGWGGGAHSQQ